MELHLGEGGDLVQPDGLVEIVELLRPNQLITAGDQADQQGHCLKQGHWSSIHYFWSANNVCELSLAEFPFNEAQGLCQSETNTQTTLIVE